MSTKAMKVSGSLSGALFPRFSANPSEARELANRTTHALIDIITPVIIFGILIFSTFLDVWLGSSFAMDANGVGEIILLGVWLNCLVVPHNARLYAEASLKRIFWVYLLEIPVYFLLLWFGIKYWGIQGAATAWSIRVALDAVILLRIGNAIRSSLSGKFVLFGLVCVAITLSLLMDRHSSLYWILTLFLIVISMIIGKISISKVVRKIWQ